MCTFKCLIAAILAIGSTWVFACEGANHAGAAVANAAWGVGTGATNLAVGTAQPVLHAGTKLTGDTLDATW